MYQTMRMAGSIVEGDNRLPVGIQVGMGTRPTAVHKFYTQGDFQNTGNALDVAVEGDGFFQVDVNGELKFYGDILDVEDKEITIESPLPGQPGHPTYSQRCGATLLADPTVVEIAVGTRLLQSFLC